MKNNIINIPNHCHNFPYCTLKRVVKSKCRNFNYYDFHTHQYCKKCMFEELTKHNYKNESE
jgi:hypothetical protein